jgi:hypothetical protein
MRSTTILAALAVAASLLAAGCAGTSATLTDRQFDDRAGAVCHDMWQRLVRLDGYDDGALGRALPIVDAAVTRLRRLAPPMRRRPAVARWLGRYDDLLTAMRKVATSAQGPRAWEELTPTPARSHC